MKYAFLAKNYREINFEKKVIFWMHILTIVSCLMPWLEFEDSFGGPINIYNAFNGYHYLLGLFLCALSLIILLLFIDRFFEKNSIKLPFSENLLYAGVSLQQFFIIIMMWSVASVTISAYADSSIRFGIFMALVAQISALVATFLNHQLEKQEDARSFFQSPDNRDHKTNSRFHNDIAE